MTNILQLISKYLYLYIPYKFILCEDYFKSYFNIIIYNNFPNRNFMHFKGNIL